MPSRNSPRSPGLQPESFLYPLNSPFGRRRYRRVVEPGENGGENSNDSLEIRQLFFRYNPGSFGRFMDVASPLNVTGLLRAWTGGNRGALDRLMPILYEELRRTARAYMRG